MSIKCAQIGILGAGRFARRRLLPVFKNVPTIQCAQLHNRTFSKAEQLASDFSIPSFTNLEKEMIENPKLDGIIITSPNYLHKKLILKALEQGKAVWVEKPITLNFEELQEIIELYPEAPLFIGQCYRYKSVIQKAYELFQSGAIGSLKQMDLWMHMDIPFTGWRSTKRYGGGALLELGVHLVDTFHYLTEDTFSQLFALASYKEDDQGDLLDWSVQSLGKTEKEASISLSASFEKPYSTGFKMIGTKGMLEADYVFRGEDDDKEKLFLTLKDQDKTEIALSPQNIFEKELVAFSKVCQGHPSPISLPDGMKAIQALDAIRSSFETHQAIDLGAKAQV